MLDHFFLNRRSFLWQLSIVTLAHCRFPEPLSAASGSVTQAEVAKFIDINTPEKHCVQRHDHTLNTFDDWRGSLTWASVDCGHNEGAAAVLKVAVSEGLSYPELMRGCAETESQIPHVDEIMRNPDALDRFAWRIPPEQAARIKDAIRAGKSFTDILVMAPDEAVGEVWRRNAMIRFARAVSVRGEAAVAVAIATASQWHNCQAFRSLLRHTNDVATWLSTPL